MSFNRFERTHTEGFYTPEDIHTLYAPQEGKCYFCDVNIGLSGQENPLHIDHLTPITRGGTNWPGNLALACETCNKRKYNKDTAILWRSLRKEKGDEWYASKVARNRRHTPHKAKLTKQRKLERESLLAALRQSIQAELSELLASSQPAAPNENFIHVQHAGYYLSVRFNNSVVQLPAPPQSTLRRWSKENHRALARMLIDLERLAGYLP